MLEIVLRICYNKPVKVLLTRVNYGKILHVHEANIAFVFASCYIGLLTTSMCNISHSAFTAVLQLVVDKIIIIINNYIIAIAIVH